ncbi:uncharacterized protein LOC124835902 [Vigna umbellata]|uniref:uncharacterized protein LOC124835902 n=1 Tax=Vigna umbellata TaxID=87088 RepID=UPI001F5F4A56|nr:uncharacterized protein LOC124835902 [Vigna umbellata]
MVMRFLAFFLLISGIHAISISEFNMEFSSEGKGLIQSNGQAQQLGKLLYGSMEEATNLKDKADEIENGYKEEVLSTTRTSHGGSSGGGGKKGKTGTAGSSDVNRRPRQNSAPSKPRFWISTFNLCVSFALVTLFPFHWF